MAIDMIIVCFLKNIVFTYDVLLFSHMQKISRFHICRKKFSHMEEVNFHICHQVHIWGPFSHMTENIFTYAGGFTYAGIFTYDGATGLSSIGP